MELNLHFLPTSPVTQFAARNRHVDSLPTPSVKNEHRRGGTPPKKRPEITEFKMEATKVTYHIDEVLECDGGGGALLRPF